MKLLRPAMIVTITSIVAVVWIAGFPLTQGPRSALEPSKTLASHATAIKQQSLSTNVATVNPTSRQGRTLFDSLPSLRSMSPSERVEFLNARKRELSANVFAPLEAGDTTPALALAKYISQGQRGDVTAAHAANVLVDRCSNLIFSLDYATSPYQLPTERLLAEKCRELGTNQVKEAGYLLSERVALLDADAAWIMYQRASLIAMPILNFTALHDPVFLASQQQAARDAFQLLEQTGNKSVLDGISFAYMDEHLLPPQPTLEAAYSLAAHAVMLNNGLANDARQYYDKLTAGRVAKLNAAERTAAYAAADQILARCCAGVRLNPGNK